MGDRSSWLLSTYFGPEVQGIRTSPRPHSLAELRAECGRAESRPTLSLRTPARLAVNRLAGAAWRVDHILRSSLLRSVEEPVVRLRLEVADAPDAPARAVALTLSADKFQVLLAGEAQLYLAGLGALPDAS